MNSVGPILYLWWSQSQVMYEFMKIHTTVFARHKNVAEALIGQRHLEIFNSKCFFFHNMGNDNRVFLFQSPCKNVASCLMFLYLIDQ